MDTETLYEKMDVKRKALYDGEAEELEFLGKIFNELKLDRTKRSLTIKTLGLLLMDQVKPELFSDTLVKNGLTNHEAETVCHTLITIFEVSDISIKLPIKDSVIPLRTMEGDMQKVHGYGAQNGDTSDDEPVHTSSQADALQTTKPKLTETPTYQQETPSEPIEERDTRWDN